MAQAKPTIPQPYPRIGEGNKFAGALDTNQIVRHTGKISTGDLKQIIKSAVEYANRKSSRAILDIPDSASDEEAKKIYLKQGRALFAYFKKYCGDPATTAYELVLNNSKIGFLHFILRFMKR
jgi:DNA-binding protein Fis